jgi:hypothetical protein
VSAAIIVLLVSAYTFGVVSGRITNRIDAVHLSIIAIAAISVTLLFRPEAFERLRILQLGNLRLELQEIKEAQNVQAERLREMDLILSILLPKNERAHLTNLADGRTSHYKGGDAMRTELRRIRSMGLITSRSGHAVGSMRSTMIFDLADYVELTRRGRDCVAKIREVDEAERPSTEDV